MGISPRILIIDDNVNLARGFALGLGLGYDVSVAHTSDDGRGLAAEQQPDAILLDFRMPFVNGVGLLYRLQIDPITQQRPGDGHYGCHRERGDAQGPT